VLEPIATDGWTSEEIGERAEEVRELFARTIEHWPR
jgi:hypothetical protein